ncbi:hypothetical protein FIU89_15835 [Roseovarius sp. THAF27]|nr:MULTISPECIES: hypothetical protein [Roseovarius]QFT82096.1 hypothetical protein FIU89_15835 [Roseovarius sp. THAF27]QFT98872.1 hypothetical protein FIU85_16270 [Roseovarius sp. THAF8]
MKAMLSAFAATAIIAVVAWYGLHEAGFSAGERNSGESVRLEDS